VPVFVRKSDLLRPPLALPAVRRHSPSTKLMDSGHETGLGAGAGEDERQTITIQRNWRR